jgi:hypothetical protein
VWYTARCGVSRKNKTSVEPGIENSVPYSCFFDKTDSARLQKLIVFFGKPNLIIVAKSALFGLCDKSDRYFENGKPLLYRFSIPGGS